MAKGRSRKGRSSVTGQGDPHGDEFNDMFQEIDAKDFDRFREEYVSTMTPLVGLYCDSKQKMMDHKKEFSERYRLCYPSVRELEDIYTLNGGNTKRAIAKLISRIVPFKILQMGKEEHQKNRSVRKGKSKSKKKGKKTGKKKGKR